MANKQIPEMIRATESHEDDLLLLTQPDGTSDTGYISRAGTVATVADEILNGIEYTTELITPHKTITGAINDAYNHGGGGGGGSDVTMSENPSGGVDLTVENQKQTLAKQSTIAGAVALKKNETYTEIEIFENVYSTEETVIGTYMGKPLYRKVIDNQYSGEIRYDLEYLIYEFPDNYIESLADMRGYFEYIQSNNFLRDSINSRFAYSHFENGKNIKLCQNITREVVTRVKITIEYTKTTDEVTT